WLTEGRPTRAGDGRRNAATRDRARACPYWVSLLLPSVCSSRGSYGRWSRTAHLNTMHTSEAAIVGEEIGMRAGLHHLSVGQHEDEVRPPDGREPVGDDEGRAPRHQPP